jgi:HTH-type transcriptional regulator, competence development regulator
VAPLPEIPSTETTPSLRRLGADLRQLRELRRGTLRHVADAADISAAYLLKLERGDVQSPSPRVLKRLAAYFKVSYLDLMALAGYAVSDAEVPPEPRGVLASALAAEPMSESEERAVTAFLLALRSQSGSEG